MAHEIIEAKKSRDMYLQARAPSKLVEFFGLIPKASKQGANDLTGKGDSRWPSVERRETHLYDFFVLSRVSTN